MALLLEVGESVAMLISSERERVGVIRVETRKYYKVVQKPEEVLCVQMERCVLMLLEER